MTGNGYEMKLQEWAHWAEILASVAVVVTLVFLIGEVRENTLALESQAIRERARDLNGPFLIGSAIPSILVKVKAVDGEEPVDQAYVDRYGMSYEEAAIWARYVGSFWVGLEADYVVRGPSDDLETRLKGLLAYPDNQILWDHDAWQVLDPEFRDYVSSIREQISTE